MQSTWTPEQEELVRSQYATLGCTKVAALLGMGTSRVHKRAKKLGVTDEMRAQKAIHREERGPLRVPQEHQNLVVQYWALAHREAYRRARFTGRKVPLEELQSEALYILTRCGATFDPQKGDFGPHAAVALYRDLQKFARAWQRKHAFFTAYLSQIKGESYDRGYEPIDERAPDPQEAAELHCLWERMKSLLPSRTFRLMELRFCGKSYAEMGKAVKLSAHRAKQLYLETVHQVRELMGKEL